MSRVVIEAYVSRAQNGGMSEQVKISELVQILNRPSTNPWTSFVLPVLLAVLGFMAITLFQDLRAGPESITTQLNAINTTVNEISVRLGKYETNAMNTEATVKQHTDDLRVLANESVDTRYRVDSLEAWAIERGYRPRREPPERR